MAEQSFEEIVDNILYQVENYALAHRMRDTNPFVKDRLDEILAAHNADKQAYALEVLTELSEVEFDGGESLYAALNQAIAKVKGGDHA